MARVRDMRNIKNVEDEQVQNNGNHPHAMKELIVNNGFGICSKISCRCIRCL